MTGNALRIESKWFVLILCVGLMSCVGCGDDGKYKVSGSVTFNGNPIPKGEIRFTPNKGNKGPPVLVFIKEGKYETPKDKGLVGGSYQLRVSGFEAAVESKDPSAPDAGKQLFKIYREDVEFPKEDFEHNIAIEK